MFIFSKILGFIIQPSNLLILMLVVAFLIGRKRHRLGRKLFAITLTAFIIAAYSPLAVWLASPLENTYPEIRQLNQKPDAIIVLGGAVLPDLAEGRKNVQMGEAAERMTEGSRLAKLYPEAKLIFSGGSGVVFGNQMTEASLAEKFYEELGIPKSQLILENQSRNTKENAELTKPLVQNDKTIILITSALHMPRSMRYFKQMGLNPLPYPVDYHTRIDGKDKWAIMRNNIRLLDITMHEYYGLVIQSLMP